MCEGHPGGTQETTSIRTRSPGSLQRFWDGRKWLSPDTIRARPHTLRAISTLTERQNVAGSMASTWAVIETPFGHTLDDRSTLARSQEFPTYSEVAAAGGSDR